MTEGQIVKEAIEERGNFCEYCGADGRLTKIDGHHAFFKSLYPEYALCKWNIVLLCHDACHQEGKKSVHKGNKELRKWCEERALRRKNGEVIDNPLLI